MRLLSHPKSGAEVEAPVVAALEEAERLPAFAGAGYDAATKFPEGFDPQQHGMIPVESE